jgi:xylulokinase
VNGTGSLNSWLRKNVFADLSYEQINVLAGEINIGSDNLLCFPFGNGAERILRNEDPGAWMEGLQFNSHDRRHMARAAQEGIVFALQYGMEVMQDMGMKFKTIRAGHANMFLSPVFASAFANTSGCAVELYNTDGAQGAARAAGVGAGIFKSFKESFTGMQIIKSYEPDKQSREQYINAYSKWKGSLIKRIEKSKT